jgi:hypothetical protein
MLQTSEQSCSRSDRRDTASTSLLETGCTARWDTQTRCWKLNQRRKSAPLRTRLSRSRCSAGTRHRNNLNVTAVTAAASKAEPQQQQQQQKKQRGQLRHCPVMQPTVDSLDRGESASAQEPGGQSEHSAAPARLYCPSEQGLLVAAAVPVGHTYPAGHRKELSEVDPVGQ